MFHSSKRGGAPARRRRTVLAAALGAAAVATMAVGCGEAPSAPAAVAAATSPSIPAFNRGPSTTTNVQTLLWTKPVSPTTVTAVIGPRGGELSIPGGMKLIVPRGAVSSYVTFQVTRLPGNIVAYDFQPHGTTFAVPLEIKQPTVGTNIFRLSRHADIEGAYFLGASALNQADGTADIAEFEPTSVSMDGSWISISVRHFSGYLISTGRGRSDDF